MKAVLISIKPKWCDLIRRGRKTVEIRKTCPKLEVPFKVYIYETMDGGRGSGLVFGEFVCTGFDVFRPIGKGISIKRFPALYESCLTLDEIVKYAQGEPVYGWQISQLKLYEEPLAQSEATKPTPHPKLFVAEAREASADAVGQMVAGGERDRTADDAEVRARPKGWIPEYVPMAGAPVAPRRSKRSQ